MSTASATMPAVDAASAERSEATAQGGSPIDAGHSADAGGDVAVAGVVVLAADGLRGQAGEGVQSPGAEGCSGGDIVAPEASASAAPAAMLLPHASADTRVPSVAASGAATQLRVVALEGSTAASAPSEMVSQALPAVAWLSGTAAWTEATQTVAAASGPDGASRSTGGGDNADATLTTSAAAHSTVSTLAHGGADEDTVANQSELQPATSSGLPAHTAAAVELAQVSKSAQKSSHYRGVSWDRRRNRWRAQINNLHKNQEAAAARYDRAAIEMGKTKLNFAHSVTVPTEAQPVSVKNPLSGRRKGGSTSFLGPTSAYRGVCFNEGKQKWQVQCRDLSGKQHYVGSYTDERAAAAAYDMACIEFGRAPENGTSWDEQEATVKVSTLRKPKTSIYKGVHYDRNRWRAAMRIDGKQIVLGRFCDERAAAAAYDKKCMELGRPAVNGTSVPERLAGAARATSTRASPRRLSSTGSASSQCSGRPLGREEPPTESPGQVATRVIENEGSGGAGPDAFAIAAQIANSERDSATAAGEVTHDTRCSPRGAIIDGVQFDLSAAAQKRRRVDETLR